MEFLLTLPITCILTERTGMFCVTQHQETKEIDRKDNNRLLKNECCSSTNLIQTKFTVTTLSQMRSEL